MLYTALSPLEPGKDTMLIIKAKPSMLNGRDQVHSRSLHILCRSMQMYNQNTGLHRNHAANSKQPGTKSIGPVLLKPDNFVETKQNHLECNH